MSQQVSPNNFITDEVTFSYVAVFEPKMNPSNVLKYSSCLLLDKNNVTEKKRWDACIEAAIQLGIKKGLFTAAQKPLLKLPIRDGDKEIEQGIKKKDQGYEGRWFVNTNSDAPPEVLKPQGGVAVPILDQSEFYSGVRGRAIISFYPYHNSGSRGIAVGLNGCYKTAEGERLDGRVNATSAFAEFAAQDGSLDGEVAPDEGDDSNAFG